MKNKFIKPSLITVSFDEISVITTSTLLTESPWQNVSIEDEMFGDNNTY